MKSKETKPVMNDYKPSIKNNECNNRMKRHAISLHQIWEQSEMQVVVSFVVYCYELVIVFCFHKKSKALNVAFIFTLNLFMLFYELRGKFDLIVPPEIFFVVVLYENHCISVGGLTNS